MKKDKNMRKIRFEIIIFIVNAIEMILELVASRIISPYFGSSNIVWTSVIGIILLSGSIGNYFGGILADKNNPEKSLKIILFYTFISVLIIPFIYGTIINSVIQIVDNIKIGSVISTFLLFFLPSLFIGLLNPVIVKSKLKDIDSAGRVSGKISAIGTLGGIVGTFLGGFVLLSNFGCIQIIFILSIILLLLIPLVDYKINVKNILFICFTVLVIILIIIYNLNLNDTKSDKILDGEYGITASFDTQYGRVLIYNDTLNDKPVRFLNIDGGYESATFINEEEYTELVFEYTKYYDLMFNSKININNVMMIGGARIFLSKILHKSF